MRTSPARLCPFAAALVVCGACSGATTSSDSGSAQALDPFSFFVTSQAALEDLSGSPHGFGGDLRYGEQGAGAGLRGADLICEDIAERSMPGSAAKGWRAFLSVADGGTGQQVDAIDRIGDGPWYDRIGRLVAPTPADLLHTRPENGDPDIADDLPNEDGVPNSELDPGIGDEDGSNHHTLTGSTSLGTLYPARCAQSGESRQACLDACHASGGESIEHTACDTCTFPIEESAALNEFCQYACSGPDGDTDCDDPTSSTCNDWTASTTDAENGKPRIGLSWPRPGADEGGRNVDQEWISYFSMSGCAPVGSTGLDGNDVGEVGQPGSYGGFYCFALEP